MSKILIVDDVAAPAAGLDEAFAALRDEYGRELPEKLDELAALLDRARSGDGAAVGPATSLAHRLRGTAGSYGFVEAGEAAGRIEDLLLGGGDVPWTAIGDALAEARGSAGRRIPLAAGSDAGAPQVLVAASDAAFVRLATELGRAQLVDVLPASTIEDALAIGRGTRLDAALIDASLGGGEAAFELARTLRSLSAEGALPLAFVSADGGVQHRVAAAHAGASLFLGKPVDPASLGAGIRQLVGQSRAERPRVLVVDDDRAFLRRICELLERAGYTAVTLEDAAGILEALEEHRPDLILLDVDMPAMSGFDACRMLRLSPRWQELPILILTGRTNAESRIAAFEAGADDYLAKPVIPQEVVARVRVRLERNRLLRERSDRDPLTGTLQRRALLELLGARLAETRRHGRQLTLALLDLDHFKQVNDEHGHLVGDKVLLRFGQLLSTSFRAEDLRGRWGGEEFLVAFPGEAVGTVIQVLARVLRELIEIPFTGERGEVFHVSFSGGVAGFPDDGGSVEGLIRVADRRLYAAKQAGRSCVIAGG